MAAHASECEHADPGSLCDCDCAGAKHAIARTRGGVPGAGQVSARAQKIAARDGRPAVVNNRAESNGGPRRTPAPPRKPPAADAKPDPVRTNTRTPRLSPTTKARLAKVRASLPKTDDDWHQAATALPSDAARRKLDAKVEFAQSALADADAALRALQDEMAKKEFQRLSRSKEGKRGLYGTAESMKEQAGLLAPHRMWEDPRYEPLNGVRSQAQHDLFAAESARKSALSVPIYPVDPATGIRQPTPELTAHLDAVKTAGRAALAEAKQAWEKDPPPPVRAALQLIAEHRTASDAVWALNRRRSRVDALNPDVPGGWFGVPLPEGLVIVKTREQYAELQNKYAQQMIGLGGEGKLREAKQAIAKHQSDTVLAMLAEHRPFGGPGHSDVVAERDSAADADKHGIQKPRDDWKQRLRTAEQYFPADWLNTSAARPLKIGASDRAYYSPARGLLSMNTDSSQDQYTTAGLSQIDEINVHEMGHRMETVIPGLTHLEFAYVRQRGVNPDGSVQKVQSLGYTDASEVAQPDKWGHAYAGKTYEAGTLRPGDKPWEVFQVGLQDVFARGAAVYGPTDDPEELQAFVIGALLTLG